MNGLKQVHSVAGGALGRPRIKPSKTNCRGNYEKSLAPHLALAGVVRGLARRSERGRLPAVLAVPYLRDRAAASDRNAAVTSPRSESRAKRLRRFSWPVKKTISLRLDADVLAWFKARSEKYQSTSGNSCSLSLRERASVNLK